MLGQGSPARDNRNLADALTVFLALALAIERGHDALRVIEPDRLSLLHVTLFEAIELFWTTL